MEARYLNPAKRRQPVGEGSDKLETDEFGSVFVNDDYRSGVAIVVATPLTYPCDAINLSAASTVVAQLADDPVGEPVTLTLPAGISKVGVKNVVSVTGGVTVTGLYHRRPPEEA